MKWLITGGLGFIGGYVVRRLVDEGGHQVRVVDNLSVGTAASIGGVDLELHESRPAGELTWDSRLGDIYVSDVASETDAVALATGADVIVHLAANTGVLPSMENPRMDCLTNVIGTFNYLEAARLNGVPRFVFASSGASAGEVTPPIHEETVPHPISPYGASKLSGEAYCSAYHRAFGVDTVALRFGNVYGPGSAHKSSVVARFMFAIFTGQDLTVHGDGTQSRDFIYLGDLYRAIRAAAITDGIGGEVFQIATSRETQVIEIAEMLRDISAKNGIDPPRIRLAERRRGDVLRNFSDTSKAREMLGWTAKTSLRAGLEETFFWFGQDASTGAASVRPATLDRATGGHQRSGAVARLGSATRK